MMRPAIVPSNNVTPSTLSFLTFGRPLCSGRLVAADLIVQTTLGGE
jgi:hypothetical protein